MEQPSVRYRVVVNEERQYSIWADTREIPAGWTAEECRGTKAECLAFIERVWSDMRPLSLQKAMDGAAPPDGRASVTRGPA